MFNKPFKRLAKTQFIQNIATYIIRYYLILVYKTSTWKIIWQDDNLEQKINDMGPSLITFWHNRLAFGLHVFGDYRNIQALTSLHRDGQIITNVIQAMGHKVIQGSTNKKPLGAIKSILKCVRENGKIIITPDGPRGPIYQVNSAVTKISYKYDVPIIPMSCASDKYFELDSWDKMILPKPFSKIYVIFGKILTLSGDENQDKQHLTQTMMNLSNLSEQYLNGGKDK
ncbi:MAG: hypothetical protein DGJ47_000850 [Rickettsiaceae bacterium]